MLFSPTNAPDTMTAMTSVSCEDVNTAITTRSSDSRARFTYSVRAVPNLACSRGAANTAKIATRIPTR